jgi:glycosyltransferase involved in cell wall biosynthesis
MLDHYPFEVLPTSVRHPSLRGFFSNSTPSVRAVLRRERPDVAIITGWHALPLLQALFACRTLGIPTVVRADSNALRSRRPFVRLWHRTLLSQFNAFLAVGKANRDFYLGYGIDPERIFEARHFVDNERFAAACHSALARRAELRQRWGISPHAFCFVYAGKLTPKKRILDLIAALRALRPIEGAVHLVVAGSGDLEAAARERAAGLPVTFAGFLNQSELPAAYAISDCLVLPSDYGETWGLVVNEAMACSLPAIVSDRVGCWPDLVRDGVTGFVFPFGDVAALSSCLARMSGSRHDARAMGERARQAIQHYSVEAAIEGTLSAARFAASRNRERKSAG